jgi:hypothetical protein
VRVEPKTESEIQAMNLRDPGEYDFEVVEAIETRSKAGNEMVELKVRMDTPDGRNFTIFDYLVSTEGMAYKVRHFAEATGLLAEYEKGDMAAEYMLGRTGKCKVVVQPAEGQYSAKNIVTDYIGTGATEAPAKQLEDDEIPF